MTLRPRWRKLAGDAVHNRGRLAMMVVSMATGMFAVGTLSTAYAILSREMDPGYVATNPPAASIDVDLLDDAAVTGVRSQAGVAWAEVGGSISTRIEVRPGEWLPLLVFAKQHFADQRIGKIQLEEGRWPAAANEILLENSAVPLANAAVGREVIIEAPGGAEQRVTVTGIVHDASVAPASQQQVVYGYAAPATLARIAESGLLHTLELSVDEPGGDPVHVERIVLGAARWLQRSNHGVGEIRIPPRHHPHWPIMRTLLRLLLGLSMMTLSLGVVLTATLIAALLAPQARQIGVMKTLGAGRHQVLQLYASLVAIVGTVAVAMGLPLGILAGRNLAALVAHNQNLTLGSLAIPAWMICVQVLAGAGFPLAVSLLPIWAAARRPAHASINAYGASSSRIHGNPVHRGLLPAIRFPWLTLGLMACAGALFITSLNLREAWKRSLAVAGIERHCDVEIAFATPQSIADTISRVSSVPGVKAVESFAEDSAALAREDGLSVTRAFPDGGHGALRIDAVPARSAFINPTLEAGRWLDSSNPSGAVVNSQALVYFPGIGVGDAFRLTVHGRNMNLTLAGIVREHLAGATIYVTTDAYAEILNLHGMTTGLRIELANDRKGSPIQTAAALEHVLEASGHRVAGSTTRSQVGRELAGHLFILIFILVAMSLLMAFVGVLGLASAMATSVLERTRELGVMRAIGAGKGTILQMILSEGISISLMSVGIAALLSLPLTMLVANLVGTASLGPPLSTVMSATAIPLWAAIVIVGAVSATQYSARKAAGLPIRDALMHW